MLTWPETTSTVFYQRTGLRGLLSCWVSASLEMSSTAVSALPDSKVQILLHHIPVLTTTNFLYAFH